MSIFYVTGQELTKANESVEHIIHRAFGGKLKSKKLLCKEANNNLGQTIDSALTKAISLNTILKIPREGKKNPPLKAKTQDGRRYIYKGGNEAVQAPRKPEIEFDENGNIIAIEFLAGQEKDLINLAKKHFPDLSDEEIKEQIDYRVENTPKIIHFPNHLSIISRIDEFRAIAKIAVNYAVHITRCSNLLCRCY